MMVNLIYLKIPQKLKEINMVDVQGLSIYVTRILKQKLVVFLFCEKECRLTVVLQNCYDLTDTDLVFIFCFGAEISHY